MGVSAENVDLLLIDFGSYFNTVHNNVYKLPYECYKFNQLTIPISLSGIRLISLDSNGGDLTLEYLTNLFSSHSELYIESDCLLNDGV